LGELGGGAQAGDMQQQLAPQTVNTGDPELDAQMAEFMGAWQQEAAGFEMGDGYGGMPDDMEAWMHSYSEKLKAGGFDDEGILGYNAGPQRPEYAFNTVEVNPFLGQEGCLQQGVEAYQRGDLTEAALYLEAEVQMNSESTEGWRHLGMVQAENDNDRMAIAALLQAVEADSSNLEALLELGVSCTNELDQNQALLFMHTWLEAHPVYRALVEGSDMPDYGSYQMLGHVTAQFKRAAEMNADDADVSSALGVLCNLSRDYDEAAGWFKQALRISPQSHSLWNKLGATQANGSRSKEAVHAYHQALALKPHYVRAWVNLGISYSNQSNYPESCKYFLKALSLNHGADNIWSYLRMTLSCMDRSDLVSQADERNVDAFRGEFEF